MILSIVCECGNKIDIIAPAKKYLQMRDNLETRKFRIADSEITERKLKEIRIECDKCNN